MSTRLQTVCLLLAVTGCSRGSGGTGRVSGRLRTREHREIASRCVEHRCDAAWRSVGVHFDLPPAAAVRSCRSRLPPMFPRSPSISMQPSPVVAVRGSSELRAWPLAWLRRRELALDEIDGVPIAVTFCSLCSTARVWDRRVGDAVLELAVSGMLLGGNSLLYDRETESLWRQIDGRAVAGDHTGARLEALPSFVVSLGELKRARPDARVMVQPDSAPEPPIKLMTAQDVASGEPPAWLSLSCPRPLESVLAVAGQDTLLSSHGPQVEHLGSAVVFRDPTTSAPFADRNGRSGPLTGSAIAFSRVVDDQTLTFAADARGIYDLETGSRWDCIGGAFEGPLAGDHLVPLSQVLGFRFALSVTSASSARGI